VSRLSNGEKLHTLIETWQLISHAVPEARLVIIGDGPARHELLAHVEALGVSRSVRCVGAIYGEHAVAPYFLSARLMLHPTRIGLSLNHAMLYGVPVATFDDAATHSPEFEALRDGLNGVAVPPGDVKELARRAADVLRNPALAADLGHRARETMTTRYTMDAMVASFLAATRRAHAASMRRARWPDPSTLGTTSRAR